MVAEGPEKVNSATATGGRPKAATAEDAESAEVTNPSYIPRCLGGKNCNIRKLAVPFGPFFLMFTMGPQYATWAGMQPIDDITDQIIGAAIAVHRKYGPGLLESVYNAALGAQLVALGLDVHIGKPISLDHEGLHIKRAYVIDLLVDDRVIVEIKCVQKITEIDVAQLLTYLKLMDLRVGLLINFNVTLLKHGIRRVVNRHVDENGNKLPVTGRTETVAEVRERADKEPESRDNDAKTK